MKELSFSLILKQHPLTLTGAEGPKQYYLKELEGTGRDAYLTKLGSKMRYNAEGKPVGLKSLDGLQSHLVSLCLREDATDQLVPLKEINTFPAAVIDELFDACQELSALGDDAVDKAGND